MPIITVKVNVHFVDTELTHDSVTYTLAPQSTIPQLNGQTLANNIVNQASDYLEEIGENDLYENFTEKAVDFLGDSRVRFELYTEEDNPEDEYGGVWYHNAANPYTGPMYPNVITIQFENNLIDANNNDLACGFAGEGCNAPFGGSFDIYGLLPTRVHQYLTQTDPDNYNCSGAIWGTWEASRVLIHEFGHGTGLCHSNAEANECSILNFPDDGDLNPIWECRGIQGDSAWTVNCGGSHNGFCEPEHSSNYMNNGRTSRQALSRCQWQIMYRNLAEGSFEFSDICEITEPPISISSNETWNTLKMIKSPKITVETGAHLTIANCQVRMPPGGMIEVKRGAKLTIYNSTITNLCNDQRWGGIYVEGNSSMNQPNPLSFPSASQAGIVKIDDSTIMHGSHVLVNHRLNENWNSSYYGGVICCADVDFIDNKRAAAFYRYRYEDNSSFLRCNITSTGGDFAGTRGVSIWSCKGIDFTANSFSNLDYGILAYNSRVNISRDNDFSDLDIGVDIYATYPDASSDIIGDASNEQGNFFSDNRMHIRIAASAGGGGSDIRHNSFVGPEDNDAIYASGEHTVAVFDNTFVDAEVDFHAIQTGKALVAHECNFSNGSDVSLWADGQNDLLIFSVNDFNNEVTDILLTEREGAPGSVFEIQGYLDEQEEGQSESPSNRFPNNTDITTIQPTEPFTYIAPGDDLAVFTPTIAGNNFEVEEPPVESLDCDEYAISHRSVGPPPYDPPKLNDIRTVEANAKADSEANPDDEAKRILYAEISREKEKVLSWLVKEANDNFNYTTAESYLSPETEKQHLRRIYGTKVAAGDLAAAETYLATLPNETTFDSEFISLQEIYLDWAESGIPPGFLLENSMNGGQGYYLSPQKYNFIKNLAYGDGPNSGGAQALLALIAGERFIPQSRLKLHSELYEEKAYVTDSDSFSISPNPALNRVFVSVPERFYSDTEQLSVTIFDLHGRPMLNQSISGLGGELDLSEADLKVGILVIVKAGIVLHTEKLVLLK